jgi:hypothetical protein
MIPYVSKSVVVKFAPIYIRLAEDPVPNIRFNVSKSLVACWKMWGRANQMQLESLLKKMAENDKDFDAKFYAERALVELKLK